MNIMNNFNKIETPSDLIIIWNIFIEWQYFILCKLGEDDLDKISIKVIDLFPYFEDTIFTDNNSYISHFCIFIINSLVPYCQR